MMAEILDGRQIHDGCQIQDGHQIKDGDQIKDGRIQDGKKKNLQWQFKSDINLNLSFKQQSNCLSMSWALAQTQLVFTAVENA